MDPVGIGGITVASFGTRFIASIGRGFVATVCAAAGLTCVGCPSGSGPSNVESTGDENELAISYYELDVLLDTTQGPLDASYWGVYPGLQAKLETAFGDADVSLAYADYGPNSWSSPITESNRQIVLNSFGTDPWYPYRVFAIPALWRDPAPNSGYDNTTLGFSYGPPPLIPGYKQNPKWTFLVRSNNLNYPDRRVFAYTLIHELGHEFAQLRHPEEHEDDHVPLTDEQTASCVMLVLLGHPIDDYSFTGRSQNKILSSLRFCGAGRDESYDATTCIQFLKNAAQYPGAPPAASRGKP